MTNGVIAEAVASSRFPPSFDDSAFAYGFALFGLTLISGLSLAMLASILLERRFRREIDTRIGNQVCPPPLPFVSVFSLYQFKAACLLATIAIGAAPDVAVMLAWGEAGPATMFNLFMIDRVADGLALLPFLLFIAAATVSQGAISHRLGLDPQPVDLRPRWRSIREKLSIGLYAFLIAVGVTLYKSAQ